MTTERIDLDAINELKEILEDEFDHLIATYLQDTQSKRDQLTAAIQQQDHPAVRELAHSIKGASINIGILKLSELCQQIESAALEADAEPYKALMPAIEAEINSVLDILSDL